MLVAVDGTSLIMLAFHIRVPWVESWLDFLFHLPAMHPGMQQEMAEVHQSLPTMWEI